MSTIKTTNLQAPSAASPAIVLAADGSATAQLSSLNGGALSGARNRIINGDMRIDQRNAGASVTAPADGYALDRWKTYLAGGGAMTAQRSTTAPAGFTNSQLLTVTTADTSLAATDAYGVQQMPEGLNVSDLGWGAAGAQSVTVSFWVRSSVTGTYTLSLRNSADNRSYLATYSVNAANTFEYKTITVPGDTTGTWLTDAGVGIRLWFDLGAGSTYTGSSGSWTASVLTHATGSTNWIATNGATFYITGVQLEAGTVATPFERRSYGQELSLCQRYYQIAYNGQYRRYIANIDRDVRTFVVPMRATPTLTKTFGAGSGLNADGSGAVNDSQYKFDFQYLGGGTGVIDYALITFVASAEL